MLLNIHAMRLSNFSSKIAEFMSKEENKVKGHSLSTCFYGVPFKVYIMVIHFVHSNLEKPKCLSYRDLGRPHTIFKIKIVGQTGFFFFFFKTRHIRIMAMT
jgi:hypothetical protein